MERMNQTCGFISLCMRLRFRKNLSARACVALSYVRIETSEGTYPIVGGSCELQFHLSLPFSDVGNIAGLHLEPGCIQGHLPALVS